MDLSFCIDMDVSVLLVCDQNWSLLFC